MWKTWSIIEKGNDRKGSHPCLSPALDWGKILTQNLRTLRSSRYHANPHWWKKTQMCTLFPRLMALDQLLSIFLRDIGPARGVWLHLPCICSGSSWVSVACRHEIVFVCHLLKHFCMFIEFRMSATSWELVIAHQKPVFTASAEGYSLLPCRVVWAKGWVRTGCSDSQAMVRVKRGVVSSLPLRVHTLQRAVPRVCADRSSCGQLSGTKGHGENWWEQGGWGVLCWGSLCGSCLFCEGASLRPLPRVCSPLGKRWPLLPQWPQSQLPFGKCSSLAPLFWGLSLGSKIMLVFPYGSCPWLIMPVDHSQPTWAPGHWCCCISLQCCDCCTKAAPLSRTLWQILCCLIAQLWGNSSAEAVKLHWQEIRAGLVSLGENHLPWLLTGVVHCWAGLASSAHTSWGALPFQALSVTKGYFLPQLPHTCASALFLWYQGESLGFPTWWSHTLEWGVWCLRCCTPSLQSDGGRKAEKEMSLRLCQHKHSWVWLKKKKNQTYDIV